MGFWFNGKERMFDDVLGNMSGSDSGNFDREGECAGGGWQVAECGIILSNAGTDGGK